MHVDNRTIITDSSYSIIHWCDLSFSQQSILVIKSPQKPMHFTCQESRAHSKVDVIKVFCSFLQIQQETFRLPLNLINILKLEPAATVSCGSLYPSSR